MIATGIIRRIDDLGRIVIPRDVRQRAFGTPDTEDKPMEFFYEKDGTIILKPYHVSLSNSEKISEIKKMLKEARKLFVPCFFFVIYLLILDLVFCICANGEYRS